MDGYTDRGGGILVPDAHDAAPTRPRLFLPDGSTVEVDPDLPPVPPYLAHLDVVANRAVPWVAWRRPGGAVDLDDMDGSRYLDCLHERTCGMCAVPLRYYLGWPVAGADEAAAREHRTMTEPGMHLACARYAARVWWTDRTWLYVTRSYRIRDTDHTTRPVVAVAAPAVRIEPLTAP